MTDTTSIRRVRHAVRGVLGLGIAASIAANVLHAQDNPIARVISAWPPGALFITVEVVSRVPVQSRALSWARVGAATVIAGIAAWVSYWHMVAVALRYGESPDSAHLLPLSVDGLVVVASICLFELGTRLRGTAVAPTANTWPAVGQWAYRLTCAIGRLLVFADLRAWIGSHRQATPLPVTPTGTPDPDQTGDPTTQEPVGPAATPDPTDAPSLAPVGSGRGLAVVPATASDAALVRQLRQDITAGRLKAKPGVEAIRTHLTVGTDRARRLRDALNADTANDEREAARA